MYRLKAHEFEETRQAFLALYPKIMQPNGDRMLCGREKCMKLIALANKLDPSTCFGDAETGRINTRMMMQLHLALI